HSIPAGGNFALSSLGLNSVNLSIAAGAAPNLSTVDINASALSFAENRTLANLTIRNDGRLTVPNGSALTVTGTFNWESGVLTAGSRLIVAAGGVGNLTTSGAKFIDGVLENDGTMNYTGNIIYFG